MARKEKKEVKRLDTLLYVDDPDDMEIWHALEDMRTAGHNKTEIVRAALRMYLFGEGAQLVQSAIQQPADPPDWFVREMMDIQKRQMDLMERLAEQQATPPNFTTIPRGRSPAGMTTSLPDSPATIESTGLDMSRPRPRKATASTSPAPPPPEPAQLSEADQIAFAKVLAQSVQNPNIGSSIRSE